MTGGIRSIQAAVLVVAALGAAPGILLAFTHAGPRLGTGCVLLMVVALLLARRILDPVTRTIAILRSPMSGLLARDLSEQALLPEGTRQLISRLDALEHRWVRRHAITGLPIRESLLERIETCLAGEPSPTLIGAIRFADYKRLTTFDPDAAEGALKLFAERLAASLASDRSLAHVDRDCFAILFEHIEPKAAQRELSALCYALGAEIEAAGVTLIPELEAGAAIFPGDATTAPALLNQALVSLARLGADAPKKAASCAVEDARERFTIEQGLRLAIQRHELDLHFQPVVDVSRGLLVGAEALLRWRHPHIGIISPSRFIPILEDSDLTREIGLWTLNAACREAQRWRQNGLGDLKVAVNLSARQLHDEGLEQAVTRTLKRHGLNATALEFELTETAAAEDAERTRQLFRALRTLGVTIAIDDFGSGYSSLSYVKNLPFDKLKIDREFVEQVHARRDSQAICRSLIELSRGLGIAVLAEGVEQLEEVEMLQSLGCNLFQGFYFSKPLSGENFLHYAHHPEGRAGRQDALGQQNQLRKRITR